MERTKRRQIPSFGDWNYYYPEVPKKHSFLVQDTGYDLFYVSSPIKMNYHHKQNQGNYGRHCTNNTKVKQRKEVRNVAVKPVDEDLYKIPPELLHEKPRKMQRSFVRSLLTGCIGLSC